MNALDRNYFISRPTARNKLKNIAIVMVILTVAVTGNGTIYTQADTSDTYFYCNYCFYLLSASIETLLVSELTTQIRSKFTILNSELCCAKFSPQTYFSVFPLRTAQIKSLRINRIMNTHHHLVMTSKKLNDIFGFPLVVTISCNFFIAMETLYYSLQVVIVSRTWNGIMQAFFGVLWTVLLLIQIFIVTKGFSDLTDAVGKYF